MTCSVCGFDDRSVSAPDAAVAVRSYDRRFRSLLVRRDDEDRDDSLVRRPGADGWSALQHAAYTATALSSLADSLRRVLVADRPTVTVPTAEGTPPAAGDVETVLRDLDQATTATAETIEKASGEEWNRAAATGDGDVSALQLARDAVHIGSHHLRAAERVINEVKGQPA